MNKKNQNIEQDYEIIDSIEKNEIIDNIEKIKNK